MKLCTFRITTVNGWFDRFGIVQVGGAGSPFTNRADDTFVVDANAAYAAMSSDQGWTTALERAEAFCPPDLNRYCAVHGTSLDLLSETLTWFITTADRGSNVETTSPRGEKIRYRL